MIRARAAALILMALRSTGLAAAEPELHVPFEKYKLPNGLRVILSRDATLPVTAVCLMYDVGTRSEEKGEFGYAHLVQRLMMEGSGRLEKGEYAHYIQSGGGSFRALSHPDYTEFTQVVSSGSLALALWLEAGRMRETSITEDGLKDQKDALKNEQSNLRVQPFRAAMLEAWPQLIFVDFHDRHGALSDSADLDNATADHVKRFFQTWYAPNNAVLVVAGDLIVADTRKLIEQYFATIPRQPEPKRGAISEPGRTEGKSAEAVDERTRVPAVVIGWPAPKRHSADWYGLAMLDAVLTTGVGSRLETELMRGRQSVLQIDENLGWPEASMFDFKEPGYFAAMFLYKPNLLASDIVHQYESVLSDIANTGVDSVEFNRARAAVKFAEAAGAQSPLDRARLLAVHEILDGDPAWADRDYANLMSVTPEQVRSAVNRYLQQGRADVLSIRPGVVKSGGPVP